MEKFKEFLEERFVNLHADHEKEKTAHADHVWNMLQAAYKPIGGIHGSGFESKEDMVKKIPFWKIHKENGKVRSVQLYKDKEGRKRVAVATDGSDAGKKGLAQMMKDDFRQHRSYGEVSGPSLSFLKKHLPNVKDFAIPRNTAQKLAKENVRVPPHDDPELIKHPELKDHFYQRQIGGEWHTKIMLGAAGKKITR
jgi:hypothetical protein